MTTIEHPLVTEVIHLDPTKLVPDPDNPRGELRNIPKLAASMKEVGVLEAITIREVMDPDGSGVATWYIVRGHRRTAAAILAGLSTVPCVPEHDDTNKERAVKRMVENQQRDDFSAVEEARGVQQLLDLGMTEVEITTRLAIPAERIKAAATVAGSPTASAVAERHDLTMEEALGLAEFQEDKEAVILLTKTAVQDPGSFEHQLSRLRSARDRAQAMAEAATKWEGYARLENQVWTTEQKVIQIQYLKAGPEKDGKKLTKGTHKKCEHKAVHLQVNWNGKVEATEYCLDWRAAGHHQLRPPSRQSSAPAGKQPTPAEAEKLTEERRIHRAAINAGKAAEPVRRKFVTELLGRKAPPKGAMRFAAEQLLTRRVEDSTKLFADFTGQAVPKDSWTGPYGIQGKYLAKQNDAGIALALFARVAADIEANWEPNSWNRCSETQAKARKGYLGILIGAGYVPSTVEKAGVLGSDAGAILTEAQAEKAAAAALGVTKSPVEDAPKKTAARTAGAQARKNAGTRGSAGKTAAPRKKAVKRVPARKA